MAEANVTNNLINIQQQPVKQTQIVSLIFQLANGLLNHQIRQTDQLIRATLPEDNQGFLTEYLKQFESLD